MWIASILPPYSDCRFWRYGCKGFYKRNERFWIGAEAGSVGDYCCLIGGKVEGLRRIETVVQTG